MDSGNDAEENMGLFTEKKVDFLCKRNLRRSKQKVIDQVLKTVIAGSIRREGRYNVKKQMYYSKTVEEFTFNILRMIGQIAVAIGTGKRDKTHMVVRKRLGTVIKEIIMLAAKYVRHARRRYIKANPDNRWFALTTQIYKKSYMLFA